MPEPKDVGIEMISEDEVIEREAEAEARHGYRQLIGHEDGAAGAADNEQSIDMNREVVG